jgi:hypothetical protein
VSCGLIADCEEWWRGVFATCLSYRKLLPGLIYVFIQVTCTHKPEIGLTLWCIEGLFSCSDTTIRKCNITTAWHVQILQGLQDMHGMVARWEGRVFRKHIMCLKQANRDLLKFVVVWIQRFRANLILVCIILIQVYSPLLMIKRNLSDYCRACLCNRLVHDKITCMYAFKLNWRIDCFPMWKMCTRHGYLIVALYI